MPKKFLERKRKMRQVFKTQIEVNVRRAFTFFIYLEMGFAQPFLNKPVARCIVERLLKIPFKSRQAAASQISKPFYRHIEFIITVHKFLQVSPGTKRNVQE